MRPAAEKETEKIPMGFNSEKSLAEVNKDCNVGNGVRIKVMKLQAEGEKKTAEKIKSRKTESTFKEMIKGDNFFFILARIRLAEGNSPPDDFLIFYKILDDKMKKVYSGTLTETPVLLL